MQTIGNLLEGRKLYTVAFDVSIFDAVKLMTNHRIGALPVVDRGNLVGMFTERDLLTRVVAAGLDTGITTVTQVMTKEVVVADINESYQQAIEKMKAAGCRHLPVVDTDDLVGLISMRDLMAHDVAEKDIEIRTLNEYIYQVPINK